MNQETRELPTVAKTSKKLNATAQQIFSAFSTRGAVAVVSESRIERSKSSISGHISYIMLRKTSGKWLLVSDACDRVDD